MEVRCHVGLYSVVYFTIQLNRSTLLVLAYYSDQIENEQNQCTVLL